MIKQVTRIEVTCDQCGYGTLILNEEGIQNLLDLGWIQSSKDDRIFCDHKCRERADKR